MFCFTLIKYLNLLLQGKEKIPAYWLAAFFNPKRVLAVVMQVFIDLMQYSNTLYFVFVSTSPLIIVLIMATQLSFYALLRSKS